MLQLLLCDTRMLAIDYRYHQTGRQNTMHMIALTEDEVKNTGCSLQ